MPLIIFLSIFALVLVSFLANPAPESLEAADFFLIALPCFLGLLSLSIVKTYKLYQSQYSLVLALMFYLSYLLISALLGLLHGLPVLTVLRSTGPYLNFFPLILLGFLPKELLRPGVLGLIFIVVGLLQIGYLSYLYFFQAGPITNTLGALMNRITFMDQRTTLPLLLAVPILPVIFSLKHSLSGHRKFLLTLTVSSLILLGFFAGIITLTRSIFLSILFSWLVFTVLYLYQQTRLGSFSPAAVSKKLAIYLPLFLTALLLISLLPKVRVLELGLLARFYDQSAASSIDYSNGRLYDEWLPALRTWLNSGFSGLFFGIGAGSSFTVLNGEERTYIHNLCIYSLVYGGLYGLIACLTLYLTLFKSLLNRAMQTRDAGYLAFSALLAGMFFYGQLFAVHKGLAFNGMLFLIIALALSQPAKEVES